MHKILLHMPLLVLALGAGTVRAADPLQPYPVKGQVVQRLNAFDNPEGAIFSADGQFVFISNSAELGMPDKGLHWTHKGGYISKLAVQPDGSLNAQRKARHWAHRSPGHGCHPGADQEVSCRHNLCD